MNLFILKVTSKPC